MYQALFFSLSSQRSKEAKRYAWSQVSSLMIMRSMHFSRSWLVYFNREKSSVFPQISNYFLKKIRPCRFPPILTPTTMIPSPPQGNLSDPWSDHIWTTTAPLLNAFRGGPPGNSRALVTHVPPSFRRRSTGVANVSSVFDHSYGKTKGIFRYVHRWQGGRTHCNGSKYMK